MNFLDFGVRKDQNFLEKRTIRLINVICIIALVTGTLGEAFTIYYKGFILVGFMQYSLAVFVFGSMLYLNYRGHYKTSRIVLLINCNASLILVMLTIDKNVLAHEMYYANFLIYLALLNNYRNIIFWGVLTIVIFEVGFILQGTSIVKPQIIIGEQDLLAFRLIFVSVTSIVISVLAFFFKRGYDVFQLELKNANGILLQNLKEKNVLLREVHHRVKNNLQIIMSLINIQRRREPEQSGDRLISTQNRIAAMALVHEQLYSNQSVGDIDVGTYLRDLTKNIMATCHNLSKDISLDITKTSEKFPLQIAIPLGLILNEILTNSFKYAFVGREKGLVRIEFKKEGGNYHFIISDDGVGSDKIDTSGTNLGISLIQDMVLQLRAKLDISTQNGYTYKLMIPLDGPSD